jgi:hypothetical protein
MRVTKFNTAAKISGAMGRGNRGAAFIVYGLDRAAVEGSLRAFLRSERRPVRRD